jgi:hypothetical protein
MPAMWIPTTRSGPALTRDIAMTDTPAEVAEVVAAMLDRVHAKLCQMATFSERDPAKAAPIRNAAAFIREQAAHIADLQSQLAAQRERDGRDAERWRFARKWWGRLCDVYEGDGPEVVSVYVDEANGWMVDPDTLDAAIDFAIKDTP